MLYCDYTTVLDCQGNVSDRKGELWERKCIWIFDKELLRQVGECGIFVRIQEMHQAQFNTCFFKVIGINQVESLWMTICWMFSSHALSPSDNRWKSVVENVFPLSFIFPPKHQRKQNKSCSLLHLSNIINLYSQHITRWFNQIHSCVRMVNLFICFFHMSCGVEI